MPVGSFVNMLSTLASKAVSDADELVRDSQDTAAYLKDSEGEYVVDPAVPEERAEALFETLMAAESERFTEDFENTEASVDDAGFVEDDDYHEESIDG